MLLDSISPKELQFYVLIFTFFISLFMDFIFLIKTKIVRLMTLSNVGIVLWLILLSRVGLNNVWNYYEGWNQNIEYGFQIFFIFAFPLLYLYIQVSMHRFDSREGLSETYQDIFTYFQSHPMGKDLFIVGTLGLLSNAVFWIKTKIIFGYIVSLFSLLAILAFVYIYAFQAKEKVPKKIKSDYVPEKTYLINGKSVNQVKGEIGEWLCHNKIEIRFEKRNRIETHGLVPGFTDENINVSIYPKGPNTLIIFKSGMPIEDKYKNLLEQKRLDLVRFLEGKKELKIKYKMLFIFDARVFSFILSFFIISLLIIITKNIENTDFIILPVLILTTIGWIPFYKKYSDEEIQKRANLPEYKVEEYKGEIKID